MEHRHGTISPLNLLTLDRKAYSLVELVLVLVVIATLAAIAAPRFATANSNYRAGAAANRIATDLRLAQQRAKVGSKPVSVQFSLDDNEYRIVGEKSLKSAFANYVVILAEPPYHARLTAVETGSNDTAIRFNGFGIPRHAATITLQANGVGKTVTVSASGNVRVE